MMVCWFLFFLVFFLSLGWIIACHLRLAPPRGDSVEASRILSLRSRSVACYRADPSVLDRSAIACGYRAPEYSHGVSRAAFAFGFQDLRVLGTVLRSRCSVVSWNEPLRSLKLLPASCLLNAG